MPATGGALALVGVLSMGLGALVVVLPLDLSSGGRGSAAVKVHAVGLGLPSRGAWG